MTTINGLAYYEIDFNADGTLNAATGTGDGGLPAAVAAGGITDLFVLSHGWNNGVDSARNLYQDMFAELADLLGTHRSTSAAVGIIWPSLLLPDDDPVTAPPVPSTGAELAAALAPAFPNQAENLATMGALLDEKPRQEEKLNDFHQLATELVTTAPMAAEDSGEASMITRDPLEVLNYAATLAPAQGGDAQGILDPFTKAWSGARELLRTMSYYEMKNRAGIVGKTGLGPLLAGLAGPPRIHLMGHSFGARLVSYALAGLPAGLTGTASPIKSLTLIQGAFSHFTFASALPFGGGAGELAGHGAKVDGPLLSTFSDADRAVGWWYPAASFLARQDNQADADVTYRWGAMGHDGYQQAPGATRLMLGPTDRPYSFAKGQFYALDANAVINTNQSAFSGAHSDIRHPEVLWAVVCAAGLNH